MKKYILKNIGVCVGDITHKDQDTDGLRFSCFHLSDGKVIFVVTGDTTKIDKWVERMGSAASEITETKHDTLTNADIKKALQAEIADVEKDLKAKKDELALMG